MRGDQLASTCVPQHAIPTPLSTAAYIQPTALALSLQVHWRSRR